MFEYQGRTALVTGASVGIGQAFARELARRGMSLILVARDQRSLDNLAEELRHEHSVRVDVLPADLSQPAAGIQLQQRLLEKQLNVDLLVNNAGFMNYGQFEKIAPDEQRAEILLNTAAVVDLCHALLPDMLTRGNGGVINIASIVAFQPVPFMSVYAATKAFVLSFSLALAEELRGRGIRVVTLCPGPTKTQFFIRSKSTAVVSAGNRTPDKVVATALAALDRNRGLIVDGWKNTLLTFFSSVLPKSFTARMAANQVRPKEA